MGIVGITSLHRFLNFFKQIVTLVENLLQRRLFVLGSIFQINGFYRIFHRLHGSLVLGGHIVWAEAPNRFLQAGNRLHGYGDGSLVARFVGSYNRIGFFCITGKCEGGIALRLIIHGNTRKILICY